MPKKSVIIPNSVFLLKFCLFILCINLFITVGTIALHEISHSLSAKYYGCEYSNIIFSPNSLPSTEIGCVDKNNMTMITLSGLIMTSVISIIIYFTVSGTIKYIAPIIFSIGTIAASLDLSTLQIGDSIIATFCIISYFVFSMSLVKIITMYFNKEYE